MMDAPKHTPGPWEAVSNLVRTARTPEGGGYLVAECPANMGNRLEDAQLIAAAPDLLAFACEWLERQGTDCNYMTEKVRAAIAKATGEAA